MMDAHPGLPQQGAVADRELRHGRAEDVAQFLGTPKAPEQFLMLKVPCRVTPGSDGIAVHGLQCGEPGFDFGVFSEVFEGGEPGVQG